MRPDIRYRFHLSALQAPTAPRRGRLAAGVAILAALISLPGCSRAVDGVPAESIAASPEKPLSAPSAVAQQARTIRATGLILALESQMIRVPQLSGTGIRLTVTTNHLQRRQGLERRNPGRVRRHFPCGRRTRRQGQARRPVRISWIRRRPRWPAMTPPGLPDPNRRGGSGEGSAATPQGPDSERNRPPRKTKPAPTTPGSVWRASENPTNSTSAPKRPWFGSRS